MPLVGYLEGPAKTGERLRHSHRFGAPGASDLSESTPPNSPNRSSTSSLFSLDTWKFRNSASKRRSRTPSSTSTSTSTSSSSCDFDDALEEFTPTNSCDVDGCDSILDISSPGFRQAPPATSTPPTLTHLEPQVLMTASTTSLTSKSSRALSLSVAVSGSGEFMPSTYFPPPARTTSTPFPVLPQKSSRRPFSHRAKSVQSSPSLITAAEFATSPPTPVLPLLLDFLQATPTILDSGTLQAEELTPKASSGAFAPVHVATGARNGRPAAVLHRRGRGSTASRISVSSPIILPRPILSTSDHHASPVAAAGEASTWFRELKGPARIERQLYHAQSKKELPYWPTYLHAATNWDALVESSLFSSMDHGSAAFLPISDSENLSGRSTRPPPSRVLDIGAGLMASWCVKMASHPGWERTWFTALDVGPSRVPVLLLPTSVSSRIAYARQNFLAGPFPFSGESFDYVRIAYVSMGLPGTLRLHSRLAYCVANSVSVAEDKVSNLFAEVARVLAPGGLVEVLESDLVVLRHRQASLPISPPHSITSFSQQESLDVDPLSIVDECFEAVLDSRRINPRVLGQLPSNLAATFKNVESSAILRIDVAAELPLLSSAAPTATTIRHSPYRPISPQKRYLSPSPEVSRVLLHAYADKMAGCSLRLASEASARRRLNRKKGPSATSPWLDKLRLEQELSESLEDWCSDLKERAGLARLLEDRLGWRCALDDEMEGALESLLPVFDTRIDEYTTLEKGPEELDDHIEFRKAQIVFAKREAEAGLRSTRRRLGRSDHEKGPFESSLGTIEFASFIGTVP